MGLCLPSHSKSSQVWGHGGLAQYGEPSLCLLLPRECCLDLESFGIYRSPPASNGRVPSFPFLNPDKNDNNF